MSDYLEEAQALARKLPSKDKIKLYKRQCSCLQEKLSETLVKIVESCRDRVRVQYREVFKELHLVVKKVKTFVDGCCYENEHEFILAAIRVTAHKERFFQYLLELNWFIFLVNECFGNVNSTEPVSHQTLQQFDWDEKLLSILSDTKMTKEADDDLTDFKASLEDRIQKPGQHQAIYWTLLRRFGARTDPTLPGNLGVPPITTLGTHIGSGGFGAVHEIKWKKKLFAVKFFEIVDPNTINTEVKILEDCCHPHIVNLIMAYKKDRKQYLMMERLSMDLLSYIEKRKNENPFTPLEVVDMILQVCEGMLYLNSPEKKVSHRDLKPKNILVKENPVLELQVADFGLAKEREKGLEKSSNSENTPNPGTTKYRAPEMTEKGREIKFRGNSSMKADMYSFAVTCSCILTGSEPFKDNTLEDVTKLVKGGARPVLPDDCPQALSFLLQQCWHPEPSKRPVSFYEIRKVLRKIKANLLTCAVDKGDQRETEVQDQNNIGVTFNSGDRPLRILVLGDSELVETAVSRICGPAVRHTQVQDGVNLTETRSSSPPMCLYGDTTGNGNNFTDIKTKFVKVRNKRWHQKQVEDLWMEDLYIDRGPAFMNIFPDSTLRLHMVWFFCRTTSDLPNRFKWSEITKKLYGLPVQILMIGKEGSTQNLNSEYDKMVTYGSNLFPNCENSELIEKLIVKVDPTVGHWKETLWRTCWAVKTRAEIENAAMIITSIRKKLGSRGIRIPVGVATQITKEFSLSRSGEFILNFLCTYWDIPQNLIGVIRERITFEQAPNKISIQPLGFVKFCLQVAAMILYSASHPEYVHSWAPAEFLEMEAQACCNSYFPESIINPSAYDQTMTFTTMQVFLQSIFERQGTDPLIMKQLLRDPKNMEPGDRSSSSKFLNFLRELMPKSSV